MSQEKKNESIPILFIEYDISFILRRLVECPTVECSYGRKIIFYPGRFFSGAERNIFGT